MYTITLQTKAPDFKLLATDGNFYQLCDFAKAKILVIFFTCNHCPYVLQSDEDTRSIAKKYAPQNIRFVAINSNSPNTYELDSYENMVARMEKYKFPWVYLYDATQEIATKYGALCTPHFFVFDEKRKLKYTGRAVDSPRDTTQVKNRDLEVALNELLAGEKIAKSLTNPIGCNIKWEGKPKHWMPDNAKPLV